MPDYLVAGRKLDAGNFVTGTVGYSLQVAAISLFLYWFPLHGAWALIVPVSWFLGFGVLAFLAYRGVLDPLLGSATQVQTMHGFAGKQFAGDTGMRTRRVLVSLLALSTIIGLGGTLVTEIDYAISQFVLPLLGWSSPDKLTVYVLILVTFLFSGLYILWGGYKAAIQTDLFQVFAAYVGLTILILWVSVRAASVTGARFFVATCVLFFAVFFIGCAISRSWMQKRDPLYKRHWVDRLTFGSLAALSLIATIVIETFEKSLAPARRPR